MPESANNEYLKQVTQKYDVDNFLADQQQSIANEQALREAAKEEAHQKALWTGWLGNLAVEGRSDAGLAYRQRVRSSAQDYFNRDLTKDVEPESIELRTSSELLSLYEQALKNNDVTSQNDISAELDRRETQAEEDRIVTEALAKEAKKAKAQKEASKASESKPAKPSTKTKDDKDDSSESVAPETEEPKSDDGSEAPKYDTEDPMVAIRTLYLVTDLANKAKKNDGLMKFSDFENSLHSYFTKSQILGIVIHYDNLGVLTPGNVNGELYIKFADDFAAAEPISKIDLNETPQSTSDVDESSETTDDSDIHEAEGATELSDEFSLDQDEKAEMDGNLLMDLMFEARTNNDGKMETASLIDELVKGGVDRLKAKLMVAELLNSGLAKAEGLSDTDTAIDYDSLPKEITLVASESQDEPEPSIADDKVEEEPRVEADDPTYEEPEKVILVDSSEKEKKADVDELQDSLREMITTVDNQTAIELADSYQELIAKFKANPKMSAIDILKTIASLKFEDDILSAMEGKDLDSKRINLMALLASWNVIGFARRKNLKIGNAKALDRNLFVNLGLLDESYDSKDDDEEDGKNSSARKLRGKHL